jgi:invasion protein IalB
MRIFIALILVAGLAAPAAWSQTKQQAAAVAANAAPPKVFGKFGDWRAATHQEAGQQVCYAYTPVEKSNPAVSGRGTVTLTVTQRPLGPRDAVAVSPGFAYPANATVAVAVDGTAVEFYPAQRSAFARDGKSAVQMFLKGNTVVVRSPSPKSGAVSDSFSLKGFSAAYAAINKACPPK